MLLLYLVQHLLDQVTTTSQPGITLLFDNVCSGLRDQEGTTAYNGLRDTDVLSPST